MKRSAGFAILALFAIAVFGVSGQAQDVQPPLTWEGKGGAMVMPRDELIKEDFQVTIHVDTDGWVKGKAFNENGEAKIEKLYYSENVNHTRTLVLILTLIEDEEEMLFLFEGKLIKDQLFYGEIYGKPLEKEGAVEKSLNLGDKIVTQIWEDYIPESLKNAKKACRLIGAFGVSGKFTEKG
ncbi:MAG: hypothetical protein C4527_20815 [Candidatus Omnitrophota bacterium]|jgi:hypothetical protein|nr:MAG: hypothetical protein C4527_20815 [Candidatus Omnitrophota bacterium]